LNLGLNEKPLQGIISRTNNERFGWDLHCRFVHMSSAVVMEFDNELFGHHRDELQKKPGIANVVDLTADDFKQLTNDYKAIYKKHVGSRFPEDPWVQLRAAVGAVFNS